MKIIMLLSNELKQYYVIRELSKRNNILGVVIEDKYKPKHRIKSVLKQAGFNLLQLIKIIYQKLKIQKYELRDKKIIKRYFLEYGKPIKIDNSISVIKVENINEEKVISFLKNLSPDLIIVFGTSLVKTEVASLAPLGIINVHTGLSPYYRGGQSAFWCLYNDEPEYIGVTIHWLNQGIDSGDIILQGRPEIKETDTLCSIECKLAILATELLKKAIDKIEKGIASRVKQKIKGRFYLSKQFTLDKRLELQGRLRNGLIKRYLRRKDQVYDKVAIVND